MGWRKNSREIPFQENMSTHVVTTYFFTDVSERQIKKPFLAHEIRETKKLFCYTFIQKGFEKFLANTVMSC